MVLSPPSSALIASVRERHQERHRIRSGACGRSPLRRRLARHLCKSSLTHPASRSHRRFMTRLSCAKCSGTRTLMFPRRHQRWARSSPSRLSASKLRHLSRARMRLASLPAHGSPRARVVQLSDGQSGLPSQARRTTKRTRSLYLRKSLLPSVCTTFADHHMLQPFRNPED